MSEVIAFYERVQHQVWYTIFCYWADQLKASLLLFDSEAGSPSQRKIKSYFLRLPAG
jgi:hypothetical protein